jgi:serine phosphatase RsbU (regulator of sigma subunit)
MEMVGYLNQAARALQTVSLRRQELALAGRVQASLLPSAPPAVSGWQIASTWRPARETSGDFYDFIPLSGGRLGLVIADVVDKGMGAALLMTLTRTLIRTYALSYPRNPELLLQETNRRILEDITTGQFVTLFYGVLDPNSGELIFSNAGHPPPYQFQPGFAPKEISGNGIPVGVAEGSTWEAGSIFLEPESLLLLYTDGLFESRNSEGEFYGTDRIQEVVQAQLGNPARAVQDALMANIFAFTGPEPQMDDMALMVVIREEPVVEERPRIIGGGRSSFQRRIGTGTVE